MPYGYDVANQKLPSAANPVQQLTQGAVQGLDLGLGLQRARQQAQTTQLQQQAMQQEMDRKKQQADLDKFGEVSSFWSKLKNKKSKEIVYETGIKPLGSKLFGVDFPDQLDESYSDYFGAAGELYEQYKNPDNKFSETDYANGLMNLALRAQSEGDTESAKGLLDASKAVRSSNELSPYQQAMLQMKRDEANNQKVSTAQNSVDREFGKDYANYVSGGGYADVVNQISTLEGVLTELKKGNGLTGPMGSLAPDSVRKRINPESMEAQQSVEQSVQRSLKQTLGGQFTEREGMLFMQRGYDQALPEAENAKKLSRAINQLKTMAIAKQKAIDFFETNGTLNGYKGSIYTIKNGEMVETNKDDFYKMMGISNQPVGPKFSEDEETIYQEWKKQQLMGK